jgi:site-specific recombinase XerD
MIQNKHYLPILDLFKKFISETRNGKRLQKNGKMVSASGLKNYEALLSNLVKFFASGPNEFLINTNYKYSKRNFDKEKRTYKRFYKQFTDFLYAKGCTDNYVGMLVKTMRSFFIYLQNAKGFETGGFYREFYANREETPVVVLSREQLQFMIMDQQFEEKLLPHLKVSKDVFVVGCTIGLRFSDLMTLTLKNLEKIDDKVYICTKSKKTSTYTRIKLPDYAIQVMNRYKGRQKTLLPVISLNQFNKNLKALGELAGWTYETGKERSKRGVRKEIKKNGKAYRFCDLMSSHVMRRTAITTLLIHGMPESMVRKISGHTANSKEFYKYVKYSETFLDQATDAAFERLMH